MPWVKTLDLRNGEISATDECVTDLAVQETSLRVYPPGTVLVAMYGGFNQIGRTGLLGIPACVNQALSAIQVNHNRVVPEYLLAVLNFRVEHWKAVASSSRKDPNITGSDVRAFELLLPPIEEQRSIAAALSDVDALLAKLDQLIAKKRNLKQAAMQQLLSGRARLPGFAGEWRDCLWGDVVAQCFSGATPSRSRPDFFKGDVRWITSGELKYGVVSDTAEKLSDEAVRETNLRVVPAGTFLMAITGLEAEGTRGSCGLVGAPSAMNQSCMAIIPNRELLAEYLFHYYVLRGKTLALQYCQGTKQQSYTAGLVRLLPISMPASIEEQRAIASVLFDMEAGIAALEARRDKTRQLKQGMMQALLTGRIRLT